MKTSKTVTVTIIVIKLVVFIHRLLADVTAAMMSEHSLLSYKPTFSLQFRKVYSEMTSMSLLNVGYYLFTTQVGVGHVLILFGYAFDTVIVKS